MGFRGLQVNDALDGKGYRPLRLRGFNVPVEISVHLATPKRAMALDNRSLSRTHLEIDMNKHDSHLYMNKIE